MNTHDDPVCTAFARNCCIATGSLGEVAATTKQLLDSGEQATLHVFRNGTSEPLDLDLRGSLQDVVERYASVGPQGASPAPALGAPEVRRGPGRPRLGVVSKEVTLLPKHWAWLGTQPGGASATLRRLVHLARMEGAQDDLARQSQDAAYRFMYAMVANQPGFEEATRALFAGDAESFQSESEAWPPDLRDFSRRLAADALLPIEAP
ncbi:MAG: DUF2239 family protein [Gemmatimonadota bacterium]|nr:DUF2239 family protein [Gemmatimonadota bacterium]